MLTSIYVSLAVGVGLGLVPVYSLAKSFASKASITACLGTRDLGFGLALLLGMAAPTLARLNHDTSTSIAAATIGFLAGYILQPLRPPLQSRPHRSLPAAAGLAAAATPRLFAFGAVVWLVLFVLCRRRIAPATLLAGLSAPIVAGVAYQSDLATLLGGLISIVLTFDYADQFPVLAGLAAGKQRSADARWRARLLRYAAAGGVALLLALFFFNRYVYRGFGMGVYLFREGNPDLPFVALTFDDGPDPDVTPAVLDALRDRGIKATFFMVGRHVEAHPNLARRVALEGHEVGNHTYSHRSLLPLTAALTDVEVLRAQTVIREITGVEARLFRPPRGLYSRRVLELARQHRMTVVLWSRSSRDWLEQRPGEMIAGLLATTRGGDVILFHDGGNLITSEGGWRRNLVQGLPVYLDELTRRGYSFVTVTELMVIAGLTGGGDGLEGGGED